MRQRILVSAVYFLGTVDGWVLPRPEATRTRQQPLCFQQLVVARASTVLPSAVGDHLVETTPSSSSTSTSILEDDNEETSVVLEQQHLEESPLSSLLTITTSIDTKTILNGIFLAVCFGYAAYTILNIDAGMTRGWTQSEIAMRIPLDNWSNYEASLEAKPVYTKTLINVVIYLLGDWLSQTVFQGKNVLDFDASRTLKNGFIGLCFGPLVHEYYQFSDHILPVDGPNSLMNRVEKIFMDQTIYLSVKASIYVAAVSLLAGESWTSAKSNVQEKIGGIVVTAWKFWPLVHCLTYSIIPAQHRILWVNCVDLVWNAILASMSRTDSTQGQAEDVILQATSTDNAFETTLSNATEIVPPMTNATLVY